MAGRDRHGRWRVNRRNAGREVSRADQAFHPALDGGHHWRDYFHHLFCAPIKHDMILHKGAYFI